jgi:hypothetical protein
MRIFLESVASPSEARTVVDQDRRPSVVSRDDSPLVDVGIPTLGESPYLGEAVQSVFDQSLQSWRLLISENGPGTELTRKTLEPFLHDPRVSHIVTGTRIGRGENWTNVITAGTAPYVGMLHDDDRWGPSFLERRTRCLDDHPSCGFAYSGYNRIDEAGRPFGRSVPYLSPGVYRSEFVLPRLYRHNFVGVPTVLVRRAAYEGVGAAFLDIIMLDIEMLLRLAARFDTACLDGWDSDYRVHGGQTSARRAELAEEWFPVLDAAEGLPLSQSLQNAVRAQAHVLAALDAVERNDRPRALEHLADAVRIDPRELLRPKIGGRAFVALAALATGARGRRALTRRRAGRWRTGGAEGLLSIPDGSSSASASLNGDP